MSDDSASGVAILKAASILTLDPGRPRAQAVAIDRGRGTILAVGSVEECRRAVSGPADSAVDSAVDRAAEGAGGEDPTLLDLGEVVLAPGFVEPHSHPVLSGVATQPPAHWIAPYVGFPTWDDVAAEFRRLQATEPAGRPLLFNGLDRLLQQVGDLDRTVLDGFFPDRPVGILDNSGHEAYVNSAAIDLIGWAGRLAPPDPVGGTFGRDAGGVSTGRGSELPAVMAMLGPMMAAAIEHPLFSSAQWYALMARAGITTTSEMTYGTSYLPAYQALASVPDCPLRISLYHMSTEPDADKPLSSPIPDTMLRKQGIKLWADGSPWVGTAALSFPYLDTDRVRAAGIDRGPSGISTMNYSRAELDALLDRFAPEGWQMSFHVNGDAGLDVVLDAYERALTAHGLSGTDHRWRIEHCGGARAEQFERVAALGVHPSLGPFQFIYWGDLLDGTLFAPEIGSQWMRFGDARRAGACLSFHNDGSVSPPLPLLNLQAAVTRRTLSGAVHGPEQAISLDEALAAHTIDAARTLHREHEIGSIEAGKLADFVELSADPFTVDPARLTEQVTVLGTWRGGRRIDLDAFLAEVKAVDPTEHAHLATPHPKCC